MNHLEDSFHLIIIRIPVVEQYLTLISKLAWNDPYILAGRYEEWLHFESSCATITYYHSLYCVSWNFKIMSKEFCDSIFVVYNNLFYRSGSTKLQDRHSTSVLAASLSTLMEQPSKEEQQYENDQVDERGSSILDRSCTTSLAATKETVPQSVLVPATTIDTATYSNATTNAAHQRSSSDASVTYITYDNANVTPLQQQQQITTTVQPISQLESLKLGAAKAKPWVIFLDICIFFANTFF